MGRANELLVPMQNDANQQHSTRLIWLCCCANLINAADRVIMPVAIVPLAKHYGYTLHQQALVLSAFPAGYISSQIVGSCAGSQLGGGRLLCFVAFMWSLATICTPFLASSLIALVFTRVVLGLGEGLGLPTIYHIFADSVAADHRSRAFSYLSAFGSIGQTIAAVISPHVPWQVPFYLFGSLGFVWCAVWWQHLDVLLPSTSLPQPLLCKQTTNPMRMWRQFFTKKPLLAVYLAHFAMNWTSYIVMHWLPTYLSHQFNAQPNDLSFAALPYVMNSLMSIGVGIIADELINQHRMTLLFVRKLCTTVGLMAPACLLFAFSSISHLYSAIVMISLCMGLLAFNAAGHLSNHADLCPRFAGISFAISNTIATLPGMLVGPLTADLVVGSSGRWWPVFVLAAMLDMVAAVIYLTYAHAKQLL